MQNQVGTIGLVVTLLATMSGLSHRPLPEARAATITVGCTAEVGDVLALKQAILDAASGDTLELGAGCIYALTTVDNTSSNGPNGLPLIGGKALRIEGNGAIVERSSSAASDFRLLEVDDRPGSGLDILNLTLRGGLVESLEGGGVYVGNGTVTITNTTFSNNIAKDGGGLYVKDGTVTLTNTIVNSNTLTGTSGYGGGLHVQRGTVTLTNTTVSNNTATVEGGGLYVLGGSVSLTNTTVSSNTVSGNIIVQGSGLYVGGGTVLLTSTTVNSNTLSGIIGWGGGMYVSRGTVTLTNTIVSSNTATGMGGGLYVDGGTVTITNTTVSKNLASGNTTSGFGSKGGGLYVRGGRLSLTNTTVSNNIAGDSTTGGPGGEGGGLYVWDGYVTLANTTVSGNTASEGGGLYVDEGNVALVNATVSGNTATSTAISRYSTGGGLYVEGGTVILSNTLLALNVTTLYGSNCGGSAPMNGGNNLQDEGLSCGEGIPTTSDARLAGDGGKTAGLADNGGPTATVALLADSPAIEQGDATVCSSAPVNNRDQRGYLRVNVCDIGAFEFGAADTTNSLAGINRE